MGSSYTGGELAAPIFAAFVSAALEGVPPTQFQMPQGMHTDWIDPTTGVGIVAGGSGVQEAFKPGTGPNLMTSVIGINSQAFDNIQTGASQQQPMFNPGGLF
jgi:penicillin-binding protein 1A